MKTVLLKFLEKTGKKSEFKLFLNLFHNLPKMKFAVIKISGKTLKNNMDIIADDIAYLNKLGIYPVIVHGCGAILDKKLASSKKIDGIRVTSKSDMDVIKDVFNDISNELKDKIIAKGGSAERVEDIFECEPMNEFGYVGRIKNVNLGKIKAALDKNAAPIVSPMGKSNKAYLNINADIVAKDLVKAISPKKFILLTETGGILDKKNQIIPFINLSSKEELKQITGGMLLKVNGISEFLKTKPDCAVVITSADNLLKEMFTIKGSGTFIKYHVINSTSDVNSLDKARLKWLIEDAFDKVLVDGYFGNGIKEVFYQKDYEGAIIIKEVNSIPYLDKFVVAKSCMGTGLGKSLWNKLIKKYHKLLWRADANNPFNGFYTSHCDGLIKHDGWNVYWRNLNTDEILPAVQTALNAKKTVIKEDGNAKT